MTLALDRPALPAPTWSQREIGRLEQDRPRLARLLRVVWMHPTTVVVCFGLLIGVMAGLDRREGDQVLFRAAGLAMLGPHFLDVFSDSWLQIGPVYLVLLGLGTLLGTVVQVPPVAIGVCAAAAHGALTAWLACLAARRAAEATGAWVRRAQWVVGLTLVVGGFLYTALVADHAEELILGLVLALAAVSAGRGRLVWAAVLLALATGVKQWAPTAGGILLVGRRVRASVLAITVFVAGVALLYLPFKLWGDMQTFSVQWPFPEQTWLDRVPGLAGSSDWTQRIVQGAAAGLVGVGIAWRRHGSALVVVIGSVAIRLLLDPLRLSYYWTALAAVAMVWLWTSQAPDVRRARLWITPALLVLTLVPMLPDGGWWHLETFAAIALPVFCLVAERRARPARPDPTPLAAEDRLGSAA
ncbi:DUF2029 domain-containing protein [Cellulomonas humilata]|uniref:DUF2029 domain-containing protein n=1 Tax=Cellulomonas humilata TaxID=144055 RepID=A0A7Y6DXS2_9CELL|nr:DUF2029 domain-containing protein [Cellulomonas humilata]NUU17665.1 DUF2029 domain-containing protein [Cellulomonas humilata]